MFIRLRFSRAFGSAIVLASLLAATTSFAQPDQRESAGPQAPDRIVTQSQLLATGYFDLSKALSAVVSEYHYAPGVTLDGSDHVLYGMLRGQAPNHMVVLVNGKRRTESALVVTSDLATRGAVGVDLNAIPLAAIRQVEITYGGQSAQQGSGAIAGVLNLVLDDSSQGGWLNASWGQNRSQVNGVPEIQETAIIGDELFAPSGGSLNVDDGDGNLLQIGGSWGFGVGESGFMRLSVDYRDDQGNNRAGYDPRLQFPLTDQGSPDIRELTVDRRLAIYGTAERTDLNILFNASIPISENVELYGFTALGTRNTTSAAEFRRAVETTNVIELYPEGYVPLIDSNIDDRSLVIGLKGSHWGWDWDTSYNQGNSELDWSLDDSLNASFGTASPTSFKIGNNETISASFLAQASRPLDWSRGLLLTVGAVYSIDEYDFEIGDIASRANAGLVGGTSMHPQGWSQGFAGIHTEREGSQDTVGLFTSISGHLSEKLGGTLALRVDDVDGIGNQFSGNVGVDYYFTQALRLHASAGIDYHAPSTAQRTYGGEQTVFDGNSSTRFGIFADVTAEALALGVSPLKEETAQNWRLRLVYEPQADFSIAAEVYSIQINDRIILSDSIPAAAVDPYLSAAAIDDVTELSVFANAADVDTLGMELTGRYGRPLVGGDLELTMGIGIRGFDITAASELASDVILPATARAQMENSQPASKVTLGSAWRRGNFDLSVRATRLGDVDDPGIDGYTADVAATWLVDFAMNYQATRSVNLGVGIMNLLDEYPDVRSDGSADNVLATLYPFASRSPYGFSGRYMYARATARFP